MGKLISEIYTAALPCALRRAAALLQQIFAGLAAVSLFLPGVAQAQENENMFSTKIKLSFNNQEVIIRLADNSAARQFLAMLPAEFKFSDFHGQEKVASFPRSVDLSAAPRGMTGTRGKLFIYAPWGNMGIFYKDFSFTPDNNLIEIGRVEKGLDKLAAEKNDFSAKIEIIE